MNIRYPIYEGVYRILTYQPTAKRIPNRNRYRCKGLEQALSYIHIPNNHRCLCVSVPV